MGCPEGGSRRGLVPEETGRGGDKMGEGVREDGVGGGGVETVRP